MATARDFWVGAAITVAVGAAALVVLGAVAYARGGRDAPDAPATELDINTLKTGDILLVGYNGVRKFFSRCVYGSVWTHAGVVWIDPGSGEPFVLEGSVYRPPHVNRVQRVPLLYWLRVNRRVAALGVIRINRSPSAEVLSQAFSRFETGRIGIEGFKVNWARFLSTRGFDSLSPESLFAPADVRKPPTKKSAERNLPGDSLFVKAGILPAPAEFEHTATCHEILIATLQDAGVFARDRTPCSYFPSCVANRRVPMAKGFEYAQVEPLSAERVVEEMRLH